MNIKNKQLKALGESMIDYDQLLEKDKSEQGVTTERMLKLSWKVKYNILYNRNKFNGSYEALTKVTADKFREMGGKTEEIPPGSGQIRMHFTDMEKIREVEKKHKANAAQLKKEKKKLHDDAIQRRDDYNNWMREIMDEPVEEAAKLDLRSIAPTEEDIQLLPDSLLSAYMDLNLLTEPDPDVEEDDDEEKPKTKKPKE